MPKYIVIKIAGPMIALSLLLLTIGVLAAYNVQKQQQENAELVTREVNGMLATEDMFMVMREIRRELDLYLRTHEQKHLGNVRGYLREAHTSIDIAHVAARTETERDLVYVVEQGLDDFAGQFQMLATHLPEAPSLAYDAQFATLNDDFLTNHILEPIRQCIGHNRQVMERTTQANLTTAQHMRLGFLLLGISGSVGGLLFGAAIARTLRRTIVQLDVSVRGVAGKLNEVSGPVQISHYGDLQGIEFSVRQLESEISTVVERLQRREVELLRSEQLAVAGQLAAGMAHELRNPLMPVKLLVQAAIERGPQGSLSGHQLAVVDSEITRLEESIQTFLDFARPPAPEKREIDFSEIIYRSVDLISAKAIQQNVELHCVVPSEKILALVDGQQLRQVLLNLLLNALDALPDGGLVEVQLLPLQQPSDYPQTPVTAKATTAHDTLRVPHGSSAVLKPMFGIRVTDTGPGFAPGVLERAFQPFITTKETGTGLGLSVCFRIVRAHGGEIHASNRAQGGAEFTIRLPRGE